MKKINPKYAVISNFLSQTRDRFHQYNEVLSLEGKMELASQIPEVSGVEVVFPYETNDAQQLSSYLKRYRLSLSAINVNVKAEPEFRDGGLTSTNKKVRERAIHFIKEAKDFARAVGADKVTC